MTTLSTGEKILIAMCELSKATTKPLNYEDIVVAAWKKFPQDFGLRGYEYPDSSNIHKPLYGPLKNKGYIRNAKKFFSLTERGLTHAQQISGVKRADQKEGGEKLTRDVRAEIERLISSDAFKLYEAGEKEKILDTDLYSFFGVTVRTGKNDYTGRITTVQEAIKGARKALPESAQIILHDLNEYLLNEPRFKEMLPKK